MPAAAETGEFCHHHFTRKVDPAPIACYP